MPRPILLSPPHSLASSPFHWPTLSPFMFTAHHFDTFPPGSPTTLGPRSIPASARRFGALPWSMYHGRNVPGFPAHPHCHFETLTLTLRGVIDHADSLGAKGRYGNGDLQFMTAGRGVEHAEMFPLLETEEDNRTNFFQIWLRLPAEKMSAEPEYVMIWKESIPVVRDGSGGKVSVYVGELNGRKAPSPPRNSWAATEGNVRVLLVEMEKAGESVVISKPKKKEARGVLWFYEGTSTRVKVEDAASAGEEYIIAEHGVEVGIPEAGMRITAVDGTATLLFMEGVPIDEPVVQHGPFVAKDREHLVETIGRYQKLGFGGWPFETREPTFGPKEKQGRFAQHADGRYEEPPKAESAVGN